MLKKIKSQLGTSFKRLLPTTGAATVATASDAQVNANTCIPESKPSRFPATRRAGPSSIAPPGAGAAPRRHDENPAARLRRQQRQQSRQMRHELFDLLEQHADSRRLMRHLALVERTLRKEGLAAVESLPRPVLVTALVQLESLVRDWSAEGLADIRSRLAMMLRDRPAALDAAKKQDDIATDVLTHFASGLVVTADLQQVSDTDHAAFREMERSWAGRMPGA